MESDISSIASSSLIAGCDSTPAEVALQTSVRKILKSRIFLGRYVERRLVSEAVGYRDLVLLSVAEEELQRDLLEVRKWLVTFYPRSHWIGITDTELLPEYKPGVCLWTEIDDKPFGSFWFQIKSVQFRWNEVTANVKCLRHITDRFLELEPFLVQSARAIPDSCGGMHTESIGQSYKEFVVQIRNAMTLKNVKDCFVFIFVLIVAIVTGSFSFVNYIGNFVLLLARELSILVHNSTPLLLGCLDFVSKIIGGFYILLAMIFKQTSPASKPGRQITDARYKRYNNDYTPSEFD